MRGDPFPGFDRLYQWLPGGSRQGYIGQLQRPHPDPYALLRGEASVTAPLVIRRYLGGERPRDVCAATYASPLFVSERVVELLAPFSGWSTYPIELYARDGQHVSGYYGLVVTGRCGPWVRERSEAVWQEFPGACTIGMRGTFFDPDSWDGSDLFLLEEGFTAVTITEHVQRVLGRAGVRHCTFTALTDTIHYLDPKWWPNLDHYPTGGPFKRPRRRGAKPQGLL